MPYSTSQPSVHGIPSTWIQRFLGGVAHGGTILDVACGSGRHLRLAHALGYRVTGIDQELTGVRDLERHADIELIPADLENGAPFPIGARRFAGVIVTNYLWRALLPALVAAVASDGLLLYETFALGNERFGRPSNPDFLLRPNELLDAVMPDLTVINFEHGQLDHPGPPRIIQRIAACGPRHPWATSGFSPSSSHGAA
jgi:SAM-dependent methyltransferase